MKLPRIRYATPLEEMFVKINDAELHEMVRNKKNKIMEELEIAKNENDLKAILNPWISSFSQMLTEFNEKILKHIPLTQTEQIDMMMTFDELSYLGWLRYQMILGKKVER